MNRKHKVGLLMATALMPMHELVGDLLQPGGCYSMPSNCHPVPILPKQGAPGSNPEKRARKKAMKARKRRVQR